MSVRYCSATTSTSSKVQWVLLLTAGGEGAIDIYIIYYIVCCAFDAQRYLAGRFSLVVVWHGRCTDKQLFHDSTNTIG